MRVSTLRMRPSFTVMSPQVNTPGQQRPYRYRGPWRTYVPSSSNQTLGSRRGFNVHICDRAVSRGTCSSSRHHDWWEPDWTPVQSKVAVGLVRSAWSCGPMTVMVTATTLGSASSAVASAGRWQAELNRGSHGCRCLEAIRFRPPQRTPRRTRTLG